MAVIRKREGKKGVSYQAMIRLQGYEPATATFKRKSDATEWVKETEADIIKGRYCSGQVIPDTLLRVFS